MKLKYKIIYGVGLLAILVLLLCAIIPSGTSGTLNPFSGKSAAQLSAMVDYQTVANTSYWNTHAYAQLESIFVYLDSLGGAGGTITSLGYCSFADTNGTTTWQDILDSCNAIYIPSDTFQLTTEYEDSGYSHIYLKNRNGVSIFGNGPTSVLHGNKEDSSLGFDRCDIIRMDNDTNVVIYGINFMMDKNPADYQSEYDMAITLNNCHNIWIVNCKFDVSSDAVTIASTPAGGGETSNIYLIGNYFRGDSLRYSNDIGLYQSRQGISIVGNAHDIIVDHNIFDGFRVSQMTVMTYSSGADPYPEWKNRNILISNNTFQNYYGTYDGSTKMGFVVQLMPETWNSQITGVNITNNVFNNNRRCGIMLWGNATYGDSSWIENINVFGNTMYRTPYDSTMFNTSIMAYQKARNINISNNNIRASKGSGIIVSNSGTDFMKNIIISTNRIDSVENHGIWAVGTYSDSIYNVSITNNQIDLFGVKSDARPTSSVAQIRYNGINVNHIYGLNVTGNSISYSTGVDSTGCSVFIDSCFQNVFTSNVMLAGAYAKYSWSNLGDLHIGHNNMTTSGIASHHENILGSLNSSGYTDFFKLYTYVDDVSPLGEGTSSGQGGFMIIGTRIGDDTIHYFDAQGAWYHRPLASGAADTVALGNKEGTYWTATSGDTLFGFLNSGIQSIWPVVYDSTDMYQIVNVHAHGIEDDSTDQTAALETLIASYPSGTEFFFPYVHDGKYYFAGTVDISATAPNPATTAKSVTLRFDPSVTVYADTNFIFYGSSSLAKFNNALADTCGLNTEKLYLGAGIGALYEGYPMGILISATAWYNSASYKKGEVIRFRDIDTDTIWADGALHDNYNSPAENNYLHAVAAGTFKCYDLHLVYTKVPYNFTTGIKIVYGIGCRIERCHIENAGNAALQLLGCYDTIVEGCHFEGSNADGYGYGIELDESYYTNVLNCHSWNNREFITASANGNYPPSRHTYCSGNFIRGGGKVYSIHGVAAGDMWDCTGGQKAFDSHEASEYFHITGNTIVGTYYGCFARGNFTTFSDNTLTGKMYAMFNQSYGGSATVIGNTYEPGLQSRIKILADDGTADDPRTRQLLYGILLASTVKNDSLTNWVITNNRLNGITTAFFTARVTDLVNVKCDNNWIRFANYDNGNIYMLYTVGDTRTWYRSSFMGNMVHVMEDATFLFKSPTLTLDNSVRINYLLSDVADGTSKYYSWPPDTLEHSGQCYHYILSPLGDTLFIEAARTLP